MRTPEVAAARAAAAAKREALLATAHQVQARLKLTTLADNALEGIKRKGEDAARRRPIAVGAAAAGLFALLAARPVTRLVRRIAGKNKGGHARHDGDQE